MTLEQKIIQLLEAQGISYEIAEHEPVYTNPAMAEALGVTEGETVKSLVLETKEGEMVVMVLPGDRKVDWKAAASAAGTKKVSFARPDAVSRTVGCEVGCVPPFGHGLPVYMDKALLEKDRMYFNPGVHHKSFSITGSSLKSLCRPSLL